jgi:hypothetical protein
LEFYYPKDILDKVKEFSEAIDTSYYAKRNQNNNEKRKKDQLIGKLGEFAVYSLYKEQYPGLSEPDLNIYSAKKKSWDFDLKAPTINLHVKSQDIEQGKKYGVSWIFQVGDKEIFNSTVPSSIAFTTVDIKSGFVNVLGITAVDTLHNKKLFKLPKLEYLQKMNKVAVYLDDLKPYI